MLFGETLAVALRSIRANTLVSPGAAVVAFGFSGIIGVFFGLWPARRAAMLDPIEALRYE